MLDLKQKGNLTELQCITAFYELGYKVSIPYGENTRYDFIADVNGKLLLIQCKASRLMNNNNSSGSIEFSTTSTRINTRGNFKHDYRGQIDFFSTYWSGKCYVVPVQECGASAKRLRLEPPKNGQTAGISFAEDYELSTLEERIRS